MGTLYLDRRDLSVRLDGKRLVIEEPNARPRGIPLALLDRVVLQGWVRFDSGVLAALAEQGSAVLCLSARHSRRTAILLGPGHSDDGRSRSGQAVNLDGDVPRIIHEHVIDLGSGKTVTARTVDPECDIAAARIQFFFECLRCHFIAPPGLIRNLAVQIQRPFTAERIRCFVSHPLPKFMFHSYLPSGQKPRHP